MADAFDDVLAESTNGLCKAECVHGPDAKGWNDVEHLELATLSWVHWLDEQRLHGDCNDVTPPSAGRRAAARVEDPLWIVPTLRLSRASWHARLVE